MPVAEPSDIVLIAAEGLLFRCPVAVSLEEGILTGKRPYLSLKEQNCWFMTCQTISSDDMVNDQPDFSKPTGSRTLSGIFAWFWSFAAVGKLI